MLLEVERKVDVAPVYEGYTACDNWDIEIAASFVNGMSIGLCLVPY